MTNQSLPFVAPLDANVIRNVIDGNLTIAEMKKLRPQIENRLNYVVRKIAEITDYDLSWWDFSNLNEDAEKNGFFDPEVHTDSVSIVISGHPSRYKDNLFDMYMDNIPFDFVYIDFEDIVIKQYESFKNKIDTAIYDTAKEKEFKDKKLHEIIESVKSKLTEEEMSYICFKNPSKKSKNK